MCYGGRSGSRSTERSESLWEAGSAKWTEYECTLWMHVSGAYVRYVCVTVIFMKIGVYPVIDLLIYALTESKVLHCT